MPHLLIAGKLHASGLGLLEKSPGITFDYIEEISEPSYAPFLHKADALVIRTQPLSAETIALGEKLQLVSRHGVGYDAVDIAALNERRIPLCIVGDVNSVSVAEHAMMLILATIKRLTLAQKSVRQGPWSWRNELAAREVDGKKLLILGYGRIGRNLARMATGFGMEIRAYDPYLQQQGWPEGVVAPQVVLNEGLAWADVVSINSPAGDRPLLGAEELVFMKTGSILVNTARGGIVDEQALTEAIDRGQVAAAGLDVFEQEPPGADHPLMMSDKVVLTPHIAGLTQECAERMAVSSVQNVLDFFSGNLDTELVVNRSFGRAS